MFLPSPSSYRIQHDEEGDSFSGDPLTFEDEGSGKAMAQGREFQRRVWREGRWAKLPRRVNLRSLADLRAVSCFEVFVDLSGFGLFCFMSNVFG